MTDPTMALMEFLRNVGLEPEEKVLQEGLRQLSQVVMELEAAESIGAGRNERTPPVQDPAQRSSGVGVRDLRGRDPFAYSPFARRDTFPGSARTSPAEHEGLAIGDSSRPRGRGQLPSGA